MTAYVLITFLNIILLLNHVIGQLHEEEYPFSKWMKELSSYISTKTIFEIVIPGAHKAGMSWNDDIDPSQQANDHFTGALQTLGTLQQQRDWTQRQRIPIYNLLMSGTRFLDLQFEYDAVSTYYAHNGLYGLNIHQILDGINQFITESDTENEIIILYLSDFTSRSPLSLNSLTDDQELEGLYNIIIQHSINSTIIKPNIYDITSQSISELTSNGVNIIIFTDKFPLTTNGFNEWFFDSNQYLNIEINPDQYDKPNITETLSETESLILNNLRFGWDQNKLNLMYWIPFLSNAFYEKYFYESYFAFNVPFSQQLHSFITRYPKLWFANVLLADFIDSSDVIQQAIILNIQYSECNDNYDHWGSFNSDNINNCPSLSNLPDTFFQNDISIQCENSNSNNVCSRSCGLCSIQSGNPGDLCTENTDCNGEIYQVFTNSLSGICGQGPTVFNQSSFCLSSFPQQSCIDYWSWDFDQCTDTNLSQCTQTCGANYQCIDGYCNSKYAVCMTWNVSSEWRSFASSLLFPVLRYWGITSYDAAAVLARLEPLRPGNSSAPYTSTTGEQTTCSTDTGGDTLACVFDNVAVSPYMTSVIGLMLIPLILSILLCVCYCCIWPWWCCCENWSKINCCDKCCQRCYDEDTKRCCCDNDPLKCIGTPEDSPWIHWIPCVILGIAVIVSLWATIDGLVSNSGIHELVFEEPGSLQVTTNNLFVEILDRLTEVRPSAEFIVSNTLFVLESVFVIISKTYAVEGYVNDMNEALNTLRTNYVNNVDLTAEVINPFSSDGSPIISSFTIKCEQCETITDSSLDVGNEFDQIVVQTLQILVETMKKFQPLYDVRQNIKEHAEILFEDLDGVIEILQKKQTEIDDFFNTASDLDSKYREKWIAIFLGFTLILVILPFIGMICRWKWCFKVNWCCSMWLGTLIMFITSFAALIIVIWGDFCVRLDEFEEYNQDSQFGQQLDLNEEKMQLVNACMTGQSIIELYGLDDLFNWDGLRRTIKSQLTGRTQEVFYFDQLAIFKAELQALSNDEFIEYVDSYINKANQLNSYCGCGASNISFTRNNLLNPITQCTTDNQPYWDNTYELDGGECINRFINASYAVQAENQLFNETEAAIHGLEQDALQVFWTYDTEIFPLGTELYNNLQNLSCTVDPLFDAIDEVVYNFSNCGFIGAFYGDIKESGCVLLFNQTYYIARALTIIAFMSIIIVFFSYSMDYVYGAPAIKRKNNKKKSYDEIPMEEDGKNDNENENEYDTAKGRTVELVGNNNNNGNTEEKIITVNSHHNDGNNEYIGNESDKLLKDKFLSDKVEKTSTFETDDGDDDDIDDIVVPGSAGNKTTEYNYYYHDDDVPDSGNKEKNEKNENEVINSNENKRDDAIISYDNNNNNNDNDDDDDIDNVDNNDRQIKIEKNSTNESDIVRVTTEDTQQSSINFDPGVNTYIYPGDNQHDVVGNQQNQTI